MSLSPSPESSGRSASGMVIAAVAMVLVGLLAWRFIGPASAYARIGIGLWCAAWIAAPLWVMARGEERAGTTYDAVSTRERLWRRATERHDVVLAAYAPYETDPFVMLQYPAISDVTQEPTAAFFEALGEAQALRTETYPDDPRLIEDYQIRVGRLERAWESARRSAHRLGRSYLDEEDAAALDQAIKLLRHAQGATSTAERSAYVDRAQGLLKDLASRGVIVLPPRVMGTIEASVRKQIEGPRGDPDA
ncbi:hypothetical protein EK0264_18740 [Epidermidibacterium keratini]|uniref:Uncharacterized protein n=1 Tax=Epidermidibacterium keratini TaxID=1891644 RepID=A0A7L4YUR4_9ACTN|nr:hypothetical protein [Epidermidibacterium keratini]QHC02107.1 hypothetical protein EK0264_18740 [Epidermidibacterium keratini]